MTKKPRKKNNMKRGTIELVLLRILQTGKKYGYQLAQELDELSEGEYELKEATMYPTLYRLTQNGYLRCEEVKAGVRRTRVYYEITAEGRQYLQNLKQEFDSVVNAVNNVIKNTE